MCKQAMIFGSVSASVCTFTLVIIVMLIKFQVATCHAIPIPANDGKLLPQFNMQLCASNVNQCFQDVHLMASKTCIDQLDVSIGGKKEGDKCHLTNIDGFGQMVEASRVWHRAFFECTNHTFEHPSPDHKIMAKRENSEPIVNPLTCFIQVGLRMEKCAALALKECGVLYRECYTSTKPLLVIFYDQVKTFGLGLAGCLV